MNLNSEIAFYEELRLVDKARLLNLFLHELAQEARGTYGAGEQVHDGLHMRFVNELNFRLTRVIEQLLAEEATRPADDVVLRMLLAPLRELRYDGADGLVASRCKQRLLRSSATARREAAGKNQ